MLDVAAGARNLLINCAQLKAGETLLIVREDPELGWYDHAAPEIVEQVAREIGAKPTNLHVGQPMMSADQNVVRAVADHDCTVFFARIGDQDRFDENAHGSRSVMSYARTAAELGSAYGRTDHRAMFALKAAINDIVLTATQIELTCPLGTAVTGIVPAIEREHSSDVAMMRFPLGVPQPVPAAGFEGRVVLARYLTPTGSKPYLPANCAIEEPVVVHIKDGRIETFEGQSSAVASVEAHYDNVAHTLGIDRNFVHSWHAGFHPGCSYSASIHDDPDRWSNTLFTNPRFLHFHTCGAYAPGEICWMVLDPTIYVDGKPLWQDGRLHPERFEATAKILKQWPVIQDLVASPSDEIGLF